MSFVTRIPGSLRRVAEAARLRVATQAEMEVATATDSLVTPENFTDHFVLGAEQALNAATEDITGIRASAKHIFVMLDQASSNGTSVYLLQLGDSGGFETTGYTGSVSGMTSTVASGVHSTGFHLLHTAADAARTYSGIIELLLMDSATNKWVMRSHLGRDTANTHIAAGVKALSGTLTQVRLTTVNGTDSYDSGTMAHLVA